MLLRLSPHASVYPFQIIPAQLLLGCLLVDHKVPTGYTLFNWLFFTFDDNFIKHFVSATFNQHRDNNAMLPSI